MTEVGIQVQSCGNYEDKNRHQGLLLGQKYLSQLGSVPGMALSRYFCWSWSMLAGWSTKHDRGIVQHNRPNHLSTWGYYCELWSLGAHRGGAGCS